MQINEDQNAAPTNITEQTLTEVKINIELINKSWLKRRLHNHLSGNKTGKNSKEKLER